MRPHGARWRKKAMRPHGARSFGIRALLIAFFIAFLWPPGIWAGVCVSHLYISLSWQSNLALDIQGYEVYRSNYPAGPYEAHSGIITSTSWIDDIDLTEGETYYYKLRAVDIVGNFSAFSEMSEGVTIDMTNPSVLASPPGGAYPEGISVSLVPNEPSTIYYSMDGSIPTQDSFIYSVPISITDNATLRFFALDCAINQSEIMTNHYIIGSLDDEVTITSGPAGTPDPVPSGGTVNCTAAAEDSLGHSLTYQWSATSGNFNDDILQNPIWQAPVNTSGTTQEYTISVIASCSEGQWTGASYIQDVLPIDNQSPVADAGVDQLVSGSTLVTLDGCSSYDSDDGPLPLSYSWEQTGGDSTVDLTGADTCSPSFISPQNSDTFEFTLTVDDGADTAEDTVTITADTEPPTLLPEDLGPYPDQGLDGNVGASAHTCIRARVLDDVGIDLDSLVCDTLIAAYGIYTTGQGERFEEIVGSMEFEETEPGLVWMMFVPDYETTYGSGLPYGLEVEINIEACDMVGNSMQPYQYRFKVRDSVP
ncbi:MAG: chitobiase/beta-hexosaminidase C-terminal domain-containing protein, partial [Deltaproteobacteria bacterium]|nr:chitobiase/beta-hexosaminidase C-terminal domain-containing protein [Deltaproteobacteria bacterium]